MSYQEREISHSTLKKYVTILDSDEGIRIETGSEKIFINKSSKRYCIDTSKDGVDEFIYKNNADEVMNFVKNKLWPESKIFAY